MNRLLNLCMVFAVGALLVCSAGCNAFDDSSSKEETILHPILENLSQAEEDAKLEEKIEAMRPIVEALVEEEALKPKPSEPPADDTTPPAPKVVCKINAAVAVTTPKEGDVLTLMAYPPSTTSARWIDDNTTMITTVVDDSKLVMTIQRQADGSFGLCDAAYSQGEESFTVTGGDVLVLKFNDSVDTKIVNEGRYTLTFAPSTEATKAAQILLGKAAAAPKDTTASGHYYSESLIIVTE